MRRLHLNAGHPPNADLERVVRLSGGSELARIAAKGVQCSICRKAQSQKSSKPAKLRPNLGRFNDRVLVDLGYIKGVTRTVKYREWRLYRDVGTHYSQVTKWVICGK